MKIVKLLFTLIICFMALGQSIQAESIFVDRSSHASIQDGSQSAPFKTITKALELARKIRFGAPAAGIDPSPKTINVHVAAGTYIGSFVPTGDPLIEMLPIILNIPKLNLKGELRFNENGDVIEKTDTIVYPATRQGSKQHMLVVTRTNPIAGSAFPESLEMAGDDVTISGFSFEGWAADGTKPDPVNSAQTALVYVDGVKDFVVRENHIVHAGTFGITTRLASGLIENNWIVENRGLGLNLTGGSERFPAELEILGNHARRNGTGAASLQGAAQTENDRADLFSAQAFRRVPLPQFYDRSTHPDEVPDKFEAYLEGNEFSDSGLFGIRVDGYLRDNYRLNPLDTGNETANVTARFVRNVITSNGTYGIVVDGGQIVTTNSRKHVINIEATFRSTTLAGNGSGPALFGFWRYSSSVSAAAESDLSFKFAHDSRIKICGDMTQFSYENRAIDPTDHTRTHNKLTVNDEAFTSFCVPLYVCSVTRPAPAGSNTCQ